MNVCNMAKIKVPLLLVIIATAASVTTGLPTTSNNNNDINNAVNSNYINHDPLLRLRRWSYWPFSKDEDEETTTVRTSTSTTTTTERSVLTTAPSRTRICSNRLVRQNISTTTATTAAPTHDEPEDEGGFWSYFNPVSLIKKNYRRLKNSTIGRRVRNSTVGRAFRRGRNATKRVLISFGRKIKAGYRKIKRRLTGERKYVYFVNKVKEEVENGNPVALSILHKLGINVTYDESGAISTSVRDDSETYNEMMENEGLLLCNTETNVEEPDIDDEHFVSAEEEEPESDEDEFLSAEEEFIDDDLRPDEGDSEDHHDGVEESDEESEGDYIGFAPTIAIPTTPTAMKTSTTDMLLYTTTPLTDYRDSTTSIPYFYTSERYEGINATDWPQYNTSTLSKSTTSVPFIEATESILNDTDYENRESVPDTDYELREYVPTETAIPITTASTIASTAKPIVTTSSDDDSNLTEHFITTPGSSTQATPTDSNAIIIFPIPITTTATRETTAEPPATTAEPATTPDPPTTTPEPITTPEPPTTIPEPTTTPELTTTPEPPTTTPEPTTTTPKPTTPEPITTTPEATESILNDTDHEYRESVPDTDYELRTTPEPTTTTPEPTTTTPEPTTTTPEPTTTTPEPTTTTPEPTPTTPEPTITTPKPTTTTPEPPTTTSDAEDLPFPGISDDYEIFPAVGGTNDEGFPDVFSSGTVRDRLRDIYERGDFSHDELSNAFNFDPNDYHYYYDYEY